MKKILLLAMLVAMLLPLKSVMAAGEINGVHQFDITMGAWESLTNVSLDQEQMVATLEIVDIGDNYTQTTVTTVNIQQQFHFVPTAVTSLVILVNGTPLPDDSYTVNIEVNDSTVLYHIQLPTTPNIRYSTVTTVITNLITIPTTTIRELSWDVFYPAYPVDTVTMFIYESGYYAGISIGYWTTTTDTTGSVSTIYIPTAPAERTFTILWDPINDKLIDGHVTVSSMIVYPLVDYETVLSSTFPVTRYATIIDIWIGQFSTGTTITETVDGYKSYAVIIVNHNGVPSISTYVLPDVLRAMVDYFQVIKYGSETIQWQGDNENARPIIIVPFTAKFITDTYTGYATFYFDQNNQEYAIYQATYVKTIYDDLMGVFTGTFNFTLGPGQWVGGARFVIPVTTTYTDVILITSTEYTTTTFIITESP